MLEQKYCQAQLQLQLQLQLKLRLVLILFYPTTHPPRIVVELQLQQLLDPAQPQLVLVITWLYLGDNRVIKC